MRARTLLSILFCCSSLVILGVAGGCGDTSDTPPAAATTDSGLDGPKKTDGPTGDAPVEECVDADITKLDVPDANLGDGGANTAACASCLKTNCTPALQACQAECTCREGVISFFSCVGSGKSLTSCAGSLVVGAGQTAQDLGVCAISSGCQTICGVPTDAGPKNDAPSDAPTDGG